MRIMPLAAVAALIIATPALGACPAYVPGDTAEAIRINQERVVCLQREVAADTERRRQEMELRMLEANQQRLEMERRLQVIQTPGPPPFSAM